REAPFVQGLLEVGNAGFDHVEWLCGGRQGYGQRADIADRHEDSKGEEAEGPLASGWTGGPARSCHRALLSVAVCFPDSSPSCSYAHRNALPWGTMWPMDGDGKWVPQISTPVSQYRSMKACRVLCAKARSKSGRGIQVGSAHCTGLWIISPVMTAWAPLEARCT